MKKTVLFLAIATLFTGTLLTSCGSSAEKVEDAQHNVTEANKNLDMANEAYLADIEAYRKTTAEKIAANEKSIAEFRLRKDHDKKMAKAAYDKKLDELEQKNTDMKKTLDTYQADGKEKWEKFKEDFSRNMEGLGNSFKDLTEPKVK